MSDAVSPGAPVASLVKIPRGFPGAFYDDTGAFSMARLVTFVGVLIACELVELGVAMVILYLVRLFSLDSASTMPAAWGMVLSTSLALIGVGAGFFTGGALLKFGSKAQEGRMYTPYSTTQYSGMANSQTVVPNGGNI
jgi:hypothetical protein